MENWPWPRVSPTGSSRPTKLLSTSGTHSSNAFWRKIRFHLTNCSVWLPPLSRLLPKCKAMEWIKGFLIKLLWELSAFISVHILTLSLCTFINGQSTHVSVWDTLPLSVSSASKCRNQHLLLQVKNQRKPEWFLTCSSADFPAYNLRTIQIRRKCGRRRTHCADCPFLNEYKQSKKSKCEHW